jgi:hypothetical protein
MCIQPGCSPKSRFTTACRLTPMNPFSPGLLSDRDKDDRTLEQDSDSDIFLLDFIKPSPVKSKSHNGNLVNLDIGKFRADAKVSNKKTRNSPEKIHQGVGSHANRICRSYPSRKQGLRFSLRKMANPC